MMLKGVYGGEGGVGSRYSTFRMLAVAGLNSNRHHHPPSSLERGNNGAVGLLLLA